MDSQTRSAWKGFIPLMLGMFTLALVTSFHTPSYPSITKYFGLEPSASIWINLLYTMGATAFAPVMGRLTDLFGRKKFVILGMLLFIAGGLTSAAAPKYWILLSGRFMVGLAAAVVYPSAIAYAGEVFPKERQGRAFGLGLASSTFAVVFGPTIAGLLIDTYGWRTAFYVGSAIGVLVLALLALFMQNIQRDKASRHFDYLGAILILVAISSFLSAPNYITAAGIAKTGWILIAILIAALSLFIVTEKLSKYPLVDLEFIKSRTFRIPMLITLITMAFEVNILYMISYFIQGAQRGSASQTGFAISTLFITWTLAASISGRVSERYPRALVGIGVLLIGTGPLLLLTLKLNTPLSFILLIMSVLGLGYGTMGAAVNRIVMSGADPGRMGSASGIYVMSRDIAAPFGLAVFGTIFSIQQGIKIKALLLSLAQQAGATPNMLAGLQKTGVNVSPELAGQLAQTGINVKQLIGEAVAQGMTDAIIYVARIEVVLWVLAVILCFFLPKVVTSASITETNSDISQTV